MIRARNNDRERIVNILTESFDDNKSINYIVKPGKRRKERIRHLMEYSFDVCYRFGNAFLSEDKKGCALVVYPDKKKTTFRSILLDVKLIFRCIGFSNMRKAMERESKVKKLQPNGRLYYLWFIGVKLSDQNKGIGSNLLNEIIKEADSENRTICLETSTLDNIPWYEKFGFKIYDKLDLSYRLFFLKR